MKNKNKLYIGLAIALIVVVIGGYAVNSENLQGKFKIKTSPDTAVKMDLTGALNLATITTVDTPTITITKGDIGDTFLLGTWKIKYDNSVPYESDQATNADIAFHLAETMNASYGVYFSDTYLEVTDTKSNSSKTITASGNFFSLKDAGIIKGGTYTISFYGAPNSKLLNKTATVTLAQLTVAGENGDKFWWNEAYSDSFDNKRFKIVGLTESEIIGSNGIPGRTIEYVEADDSESIMFMWQDTETERSTILSAYEEIFLTQFDLVLNSPDYTDEKVTTGLTFAAYDSDGTQQTLNSYFDTVRVVANCDNTSSQSRDLTGDLSSYEFELDSMMTDKFNSCLLNVYGTPNTAGQAFFQGQPLYVSKVKLEIPGGSTTYWTPSDSYSNNQLFSLNPAKAGRGMLITELAFQ